VSPGHAAGDARAVAGKFVPAYRQLIDIVAPNIYPPEW
jgi:hypothetical protein